MLTKTEEDQVVVVLSVLAIFLSNAENEYNIQPLDKKKRHLLRRKKFEAFYFCT